MKKIFLIVVLVNSLSILYSNQSIHLNNFKKDKISFYSNDDILEVQKIIQDKLDSLELNKDNLSEELYLTLENNLTIEKINFMSKDENAPKEAYLLINNQALKNELFMNDKKMKKLSSDYLVSVADLKTRLLNFLTTAKMYSESMIIKDLYLTAIKNNKKSSSAYLGYGIWLYFAPPIVGGGHQESYKKIIEAEKNAVCAEDLYFVLLYKSQLLFVMSRKEEYAQTLTKARSLFPNEVFTKKIEAVNEQGSVFFD